MTQTIMHKLRQRMLLALVVGLAIPTIAHGQWHDSYKNLSEVYARVDEYATEHSDLVTTSVIGQSYEGRDIRAFKVTGTNGTRDVKPAILLNSMMHAREWITPMANMFIADQLLAGYGSDARITQLLDQFDVHFIPINNPDGYEFSWSDPANRLWRKNRRPNADGTYGVDLNRNFDFSWGTAGSSSVPNSDTYRGTAPFSEPETRAMRDFYEAHPNIISNADLHSYSQLILGPFGHSASEVAPDATLLDKVGEEMERAIVGVHSEPYTYQRASDLYIASGLQADWAYGTQNVYSYTYELRPNTRFWGFRLPEDEIIPASEEAYAGVRALFDFAYDLTTGDLDYDGQRDCHDLDLLTTEVASNFGPLEFQDKFELDLSGDGAISEVDVSAWLAASGYLGADANLDGVVDEADRLILEANRNSTTHSFCQGDLNTDGIVNDMDFAIWQSVVPEPNAWALLAIGMIGLLRIRKRANRLPA